MFYEPSILNKGGALHPLWVAAHCPHRLRGVQHLNLPQLCTWLFDIINTETANPQKRFSLKLSQILLRGAVEIHRLQTDHLMRKVLNFNPNKMPRIRQKREGRPEQQQQEEQIPVANEEEALPRDEPLPRVEERIPPNEELPFLASVEDITMREDAIPRTEPPQGDFGDLEEPTLEDIINQMNVLKNAVFEVSAPVGEPNEPGEAPAGEAPIEMPAEPTVALPDALPEIIIDNVPPPVETGPSGFNSSRFVLSPLESDQYVPIRQKRNKKCRIIRDEAIQITSECMKAALADPFCHTRCKEPGEDIQVVTSFLFADELFSRPGRFGAISEKIIFPVLRNLVVQKTTARRLTKELQQSKNLEQQPKDLEQQPIEIEQPREMEQQLGEMVDQSKNMDVEVMIGEANNTMLGNASIMLPIAEQTGMNTLIEDMPGSSLRMTKGASPSVTMQDLGVSAIGEAMANASIVEGLASMSVMDQSYLEEQKRQLDKEWGQKGTVLKIIELKRARKGPVNIENLISNQEEEKLPLKISSKDWKEVRSKRLAASKAFASVLGLLAQGILKVKKSENNEIFDLKLGPKFRKPDERPEE